MKRLILLGIVLLLLSGCGVPAWAARSEPTTLQVSRVTALGYLYPSFSPHTITDQQSVQNLYNTIQALPHPTGSVRICLFDRGIDYHLDFFQDHILMQEVIFHASGCASIHIGKNDMREPDEAFTRLFAQMVGLSEYQLVSEPLYP